MSLSLSPFYQRLSTCLNKNRPAILRLLKSIRQAQQANKSTGTQLEQLEARLSQAQEAFKQRAQSLPQAVFDDFLPVNQRLDDLKQAILAHQVVIVCGETGSGKTTQLPKICLSLGRGVAGMIGHTQPRRLAARSVANRIAQELATPVGDVVGYKVRFGDKVSQNTAIKLMTDGILLAETQSDKHLYAYDTIIIDEAHERSLNIDFLLGYLKVLLPKRPDLKVIVTSATIDASRFSQHFNQAPVIEVSGRTYPVEVRYRPLLKDKLQNDAPTEDKNKDGVDMEAAIVDAVDELYRHGTGDTLIFLPGEREIRDAAEALRKHHPAGAEILPLFARLSNEEQQKIFKPSHGRRIVLATNVAETSLTVPGIRYVIDTGLARVNRYSPRSKIELLQIESISQASANQRAGRCGRVMSGVCIRLYSEESFALRKPFTDPEILRSSLASVILRMEALQLGDVNAFPFLEAPSSRMISDGYQLLQELGAVDEQRKLTPLGRQLAKLPIDPKVGRMLLAGEQHHCLQEVLIIASAMSLQDPRERPFEAREAADRAQQRFADEKSDFVSYLRLWDFFDEALKHKKSNRQLQQLCREHFLSHLRLREWRELHGQLAAMLSEIGFKENASPATYEQIHKALLAGLVSHIGMKQTDSDEYMGARGGKFSLFPGSGLRKSKPKWVMAAELTDTGKLYARCVAKIEPEWAEAVAGHLCKSHYFDPHWEQSSAQVIASERVTLFGLNIIPKRKVHYGKINPTEAREIFIRAALANGQLNTKAPFFTHNQQLITEVEELEHKARRQDILVDEQVLFDFYDARIPADIMNGASFENWRKQAEALNPKQLFLNRDDLLRRATHDVSEAQFPTVFTHVEQAFALQYRFEPSHPLDGVTVEIPLHALNRVSPEPFDWLVAGMVREKITALLKNLPKAIRRNCLPLPEFVTAFLQDTPLYSTPLYPALSHFVERKTQCRPQADDWHSTPLPAHLQMNFRVVDDAGHALAESRDLSQLQQQLGQAAQLTFRANETTIERDNIKAWDLGDLPEEIAFTRQGQTLVGYPALTALNGQIALRLFDTKAIAQKEMRIGVRLLLQLDLKEQMKQLEKSLPQFTQTALLLRGICPSDDLQQDLITCICDRAFIGDDELPRTESAYQAQKQRARTRLPAVRDAACKMLADIATDYQQVQPHIHKIGKIQGELKQQIDRLLARQFMQNTPWEQLGYLPRYLKAIRLRIDKYPSNPSRDAQHSHDIAQLWQHYETAFSKNPPPSEDKFGALQKFRWSIEELRVSLFAQELRTPMPVSVKRLQKLWGDISR